MVASNSDSLDKPELDEFIVLGPRIACHQAFSQKDLHRFAQKSRARIIFQECFPLFSAVAGFLFQFAFGAGQGIFAWFELAGGHFPQETVGRVAILPLHHDPGVLFAFGVVHGKDDSTAIVADDITRALFSARLDETIRTTRNKGPSKTTSELSTWAVPVILPLVLPFFRLGLFCLAGFLLCDFIFSEFASESEADNRAAFTFLGIVVFSPVRTARSKSSIRHAIGHTRASIAHRRGILNSAVLPFEREPRHSKESIRKEPLPTADCFPITAAPGLSRLFLDFCAGADSARPVLCEWRRPRRLAGPSEASSALATAGDVAARSRIPPRVRLLRCESLRQGAGSCGHRAAGGAFWRTAVHALQGSDGRCPRPPGHGCRTSPRCDFLAG